MSVENSFISNSQQPEVLKKNTLATPEKDQSSDGLRDNDLEYQKKKAKFFVALNKYEIKLRNEQPALLESAAERVGDVLGQHGILKDMGDVAGHVHIVMPDFYKDFVNILGENPVTEAEMKQIGGAYASHFGEIVLTWKATETSSEFVMKATHEILHFFQFDNRKQNKGEQSLGGESLGMMMEGNGKVLFGHLLEAMTQKLTIEAMSVIQNSAIEGEQQKLRELFGKRPEEGYLLGTRVKGKYGYINEYKPIIVYKALLEKFDEMIEKIYQENKDQFQSKDEVFEVFVQAAYVGKKLPLMRLIHRTYGVKSDVLKTILKFFGKESPLREVGKKWSE